MRIYFHLIKQSMDELKRLVRQYQGLNASRDSGDFKSLSTRNYVMIELVILCQKVDFFHYQIKQTLLYKNSHKRYLKCTNPKYILPF